MIESPLIAALKEKMGSNVKLLIQAELQRQKTHLELIASENIVSKAVLDATGSVLTNKYAEGYPNRRYYGGCKYVDEIELLAINTAKKLFNAEYVNVQPHSGSSANLAAFLSILKPGDTILGMALPSGGHLTHGSPVNFSGKLFRSVSYSVSKKNYLIDYDNILDIAKKEKPKLIIAGFSAYSRSLDFKKFREIADSVGAYLLADIAHIAGLVATGFHQNPLMHADIVTATTHKTLRGPRGGMIMTNNEDLAKKINSAIFPGIQGGPLMHVIAGKAIAFQEALSDGFKDYIGQVIKNAQVFAASFVKKGLDVLTGGTDNHLFMVDLRNVGLTGKLVEEMLDQVNITLNKNSIPFDKESPFITSGIRCGTPACTTRGFKEKEFEVVAEVIFEVISLLKAGEFNIERKKEVSLKVEELCNKFPIYE